MCCTLSCLFKNKNLKLRYSQLNGIGHGSGLPLSSVPVTMLYYKVMS